MPLSSEAGEGLAMALLKVSLAPLLLLDGELRVVGGSASFCREFGIAPDAIAGRKLFELGQGEWYIPQLEALLIATARGRAAVDAYELDFARPGGGTRRLVVSAHKLDYADGAHVRIVVSIADVTDARLLDKQKDDLVREKQILLQELQHRVANSLQIIASVLMQSARKVQSEETRGHLRDAHDRVMSIATLQRQLATTRFGDVELRPYFQDLCRSIGASMIGDRDKLMLTVTVDDSVASAEVSVSLGLIVTELVINALKHAFPGQATRGTIAVDYRSGNGDWDLTVSDDGIGMPKGDDVAKPGLGTGIVDALSKQLDATVTVSDAEPGTSVSVSHRGAAKSPKQRPL